jgi:hypothetical protein
MILFVGQVLDPSPKRREDTERPWGLDITHITGHPLAPAGHMTTDHSKAGTWGGGVRNRSRLGVVIFSVGLLLALTVGLTGCDSGSQGGKSGSVSTTAVLGSSTTSSAATSTTPTTALGAAAGVISRAVELARTLPMEAALETGAEQPWTFFFAQSGWLLQTQDPQRAAPRTAMGRKGDLYFWTTAFEGEQRIVTSTLEELGSLYHDKTVPNGRVRQNPFIGGEFLTVLQLFNPVDDLALAEARGEPEHLPAGGERVRAELQPFALIKPLLEPFDVTDPDSLQRLQILPPELLMTPIDLVLEVDKDGAPVKLVATSRAILEGSPAQPLTFDWHRAAPPSFPLADALDFATVLAEPWPTDWMPAYRLQPPQPTKTSVQAYLKQQRDNLALALQKMKWPEMRALVTFRRPLDDATATSIASGPNLRVEYLEWETTDGKRGSTSAMVAKTTEKIRQVFYPDKPAGYVRLVAVGLIGRFTDYEPISKNPDVLLVDLGPVPDLIDPLLAGESVIGEPTRGLYWIWVQAGRP